MHFTGTKKKKTKRGKQKEETEHGTTHTLMCCKRKDKSHVMLTRTQEHESRFSL